MNRMSNLMTSAGQGMIRANGEMLLRLSVSCLEVAQILGDALTECESANRTLNRKRNYEGRANTASQDRVGSTTVALEARLRVLCEFYNKCGEYLNNVWEQMSAVDEELAQQIMMEFAFNNQAWLNGLFGGTSGGV